MRNRSRLLLAVPGVVLATGWPQPAGAASFRLSRWSEFTFSARPSSPPQDGALTPAARRFSWTGWRPFDDPAVRGQANVSQFARHVHFQRFRLLALNGTTPFPLAAFELGSNNRFGNRLAIDAGVFRYRYGCFRLTL